MKKIFRKILWRLFPKYGMRAKERLTAQAMSTMGNMQKFAAALASPIRRSMDYQGIMRRACIVEPIPEGALPDFNRMYPPVEESEKIIDTIKIVHSLGTNTKMKFIIKMMET